MQNIAMKDKYCLTVAEAAIYFNIGEKKIRHIVVGHLDTGLVIQNGSKILINRKNFEKFLDKTTSI